jgi:pyruvate,water dikinase
MQDLTAAMSGSLQVLDRLGVLAEMSGALAGKSTSTNYLAAFRDLQRGRIDRAAFVRRFGHRGFYESDLAQPRFADYGAAEWEQLLGAPPGAASEEKSRPQRPAGIAVRGWALLFRRTIRLVHTREQLRHEVMRYFYRYRRELEQASRSCLPAGAACWDYRPEELERLFRSDRPVEPEPFVQSGWDMDTFLCNRLGRRLPLGVLDNVAPGTASSSAIGIYPGRIRGRVWRVRHARLDTLLPPPYRPVILVADALDPGWIPFFAKVDGVISYTGGLLSHASIILRESRIPAITQLPGYRDLQTGDWIEMDGRTGEVIRLEEKEY